jgi:hypothetical protein
MTSAAYYRQQAETLRNLARAMTDEDLAFAYHLRAVEYNHLADQAESEGHAQQQGTRPPPSPPSADQPAQQQQQAQPKKANDSE